MKICGVYKITNLKNERFYIGASVDIKGRYSQHVGKSCSKYKDSLDFYRDIYELGKSNFELEILEVCDKDDLLEREQYWYDELNPTYNIVRPSVCNFTNAEVNRRALESCQSEEHRQKMKIKYSTDEYRELFRRVNSYKMKRVRMLTLDSILVIEFISFQEGARWLSENTEFTGKNKASKIKAVCDGERQTAFGYKWEYCEV